MTPEANQKMSWLCERIQVEQDQETFNDLVRQLNDLLRNAESDSARSHSVQKAG